MASRTILEGYDYDIGRWTEKQDFDGDVMVEQAVKLGFLKREGEAWRLLVAVRGEITRVCYLSRPEGF